MKKRILLLGFLFVARQLSAFQAKDDLSNQFRQDKSQVLALVFTSVTKEMIGIKTVVLPLTTEEIRNLKKYLLGNKLQILTEEEARKYLDRKKPQAEQGVAFLELKCQRISSTEATVIGGERMVELSGSNDMFYLKKKKKVWRIVKRELYEIS